MKGRYGEQTLDNTVCKAGISSVSDSWLGLLPFDHVHNRTTDHTMNTLTTAPGHGGGLSVRLSEALREKGG